MQEKLSHRWVQLCESFQQLCATPVNARCQGDENTNSSIVAETMKLLANNSYGYQDMDRSRHSITNYTNDEKTCGGQQKKFKK